MKKCLILFFLASICFKVFATDYLTYTNTTYAQILDKSYVNNLVQLVKNSSIKTSEIKIIEDAWLKRFTNEWLIATLSYEQNCKFDFLGGLIIPAALQMPRLQKNYEAALKKSNRHIAYDLYIKYHNRPTMQQFKQYLDSPDKTLQYMNEEMYWEINLLCSILFDHMFKLKHDQLISNGYPIWKTGMTSNKTLSYSDGAEALLKFSEESAATFNEPYMFGLNSKLLEVGITKKFNNPHLWPASDAKNFTHKIIFGEVTPTPPQIWQLRLCLGCNAINELNDRLLHGDAKLRERTGGDATKVRAGK